MYEVTLNGRTRWVFAISKKAIKDLMVNPSPTAIIYRPEVKHNPGIDFEI